MPTVKSERHSLYQSRSEAHPLLTTVGVYKQTRQLRHSEVGLLAKLFVEPSTAEECVFYDLPAGNSSNKAECVLLQSRRGMCFLAAVAVCLALTSSAVGA